MRLIFIRHAEPDYEHDSVTERGEREARLLAERLAREKVDGVYISSLGRAQRTAQAYLKKVNGQGETQLDVINKKLKAKFNVSAVLKTLLLCLAAAEIVLLFAALYAPILTLFASVL